MNKEEQVRRLMSEIIFEYEKVRDVFYRVTGITWGGCLSNNSLFFFKSKWYAGLAGETRSCAECSAQDAYQLIYDNYNAITRRLRGED
jgi:hypothetical protein